MLSLPPNRPRHFGTCRRRQVFYVDAFSTALLGYVALMIDHVRHRGRDGFWRLIDFLHDLLDRIARNWIDLQFHFLGVSKKLPVLHGIHECLAQSDLAVRWN